MPDSYPDGRLEERIERLEVKLKKQEEKIVLLADMLHVSSVLARRSSPFDHPLKQFFDAPEFWEMVYEDPAACQNRCPDYQDGQEACNGDEDCLDQLSRDIANCVAACGPIGGIRF